MKHTEPRPLGDVLLINLELIQQGVSTRRPLCDQKLSGSNATVCNPVSSMTVWPHRAHDRNLQRLEIGVESRSRFSSLVTDALLIPPCIDISRGIPVPASEHVGRASAALGVFEPIHKEAGGTQPRDPQCTTFFHPEPPPHCSRLFPRSLRPPRRVSVSKEYDKIKMGGCK